jgi:hypothetical protein
MRPPTGLDEPGSDQSNARVSWKAVALPAEHGGWGMLGEPLLLALLLAPSAAGAGFALAAVAAFLVRHPLKLALADRWRGARYPRTAVAEKCAALYGVAGLAGLALGAWQAGLTPFIPLAVAAPFALLQLAYDARHQGRRLAPELLGGAALGSAAAAVMLAGGWPWAVAWAVWALMAAKAVSSVLYVRTRFRMDRGLGPSVWPAGLAHLVAIGMAAGLALLHVAPWLSVPAFVILLGRMVHGLSARHRRLRPQAVGMQEMAFGFLTTLLLALGYVLTL